MLAHFGHPRNSSTWGSPDLPPKSGNIGVTCAVARGRALFWQGEYQSQTIKILRGVVRIVRLIEDGNRQVLSFYWPGDIVPVHALSRLFTAETITPCKIVRYSFLNGEYLRDNLRDVDQIVENMLSLLLMMGKKNSISRIASLLLSVRRHLPSDTNRQMCFQLSLPRADIADHVGTSVETVCRALAEFKARKLIELPTRKTIRFLDIAGLSRIADA
jgi:CRP-like cAMP-binding protein